MKCSWITSKIWAGSLVFAESGTYYNIVKDFGKVRLETIETEYQAHEISTLRTENIKKHIPRPLQLAF